MLLQRVQHPATGARADCGAFPWTGNRLGPSSNKHQASSSGRARPPPAHVSAGRPVAAHPVHVPPARVQRRRRQLAAAWQRRGARPTRAAAAAAAALARGPAGAAGAGRAFAEQCLLSLGHVVDEVVSKQDVPQLASGVHKVPARGRAGGGQRLVGGRVSEGTRGRWAAASWEAAVHTPGGAESGAPPTQHMPCHIHRAICHTLASLQTRPTPSPRRAPVQLCRQLALPVRQPHALRVLVPRQRPQHGPGAAGARLCVQVCARVQERVEKGALHLALVSGKRMHSRLPESLHPSTDHLPN